MIEKTIFISHVHEDADLAVALKDLIEDAFTGEFTVFVSSDRRSLDIGEDWLPKIKDNLQKASDFIIILSPHSLGRPWVNFEAGAAFGRDINIIPICVRGISVDHVGPPLSSKQLLSIHGEGDVQAIINQIARRHVRRPKADPKLLKATANLIAVQPDDPPPPLTFAAKNNEPIILGKMREEWDKEADISIRRTFWEALGECYARHFREQQGYPDTFEALVDLAKPPQGLPLNQGEHLRDYPGKYGRLLIGHDLQLHRVCKAVYPPKDPSRTLKDCSVIAQTSFDAFHSARGLFAKFWNRVGEDVYVRRIIGLDIVVQEFEPHRRLVNLLTYLEISLIQWTQDAGVGKQWLFRLNSDWSRI